MKTAGTLRKKGLGGVDHFMKKDKSKNSLSSSSVISTPTTSSSPKVVAPPVKVVQQAPITVDLHRFADSNLQPEDCK